MHVCFSCGTEWQGESKVPFRELCPDCGAFLHCCLNCRLYDRFAHQQCRSDTTEPPRDKDRGNFCEEFIFRSGEPPKKPGGGAGRGKFNDLFGK